MNGNHTHKTPRDPLDFYPTPLGVTGVLRDWLSAQPDRPGLLDSFCDPAGGEGAIIEAIRYSWRYAFWYSIEIDPTRSQVLRAISDEVSVGDALTIEWPDAHILANPPFMILDEMWQKASAHRECHNRWVAMLTPVAWWNAERRSGYVRPDYMLALGWRPVFRRQIGAGHKGSQDFIWAILSPAQREFTTWVRVEKPMQAVSPSV